MKRFLIGASALILTAGAAHATQPNSTAGEIDTSATASANPVAISGSSASSTSGAQAGAVSGSVSGANAQGGSAHVSNVVSPTIKTSVDTTDVNLNSNRQGQGQQQGQQQALDARNSQSQSSTSKVTGSGNSSVRLSPTQTTTLAGNNASQNVGGQSSSNTNVNNTYNPRNVATAYAPPVVNVASCSIGMAAGGQAATFGFSIGAGRTDHACNVRANAQVLFQLGEQEAAIEYLTASDPEMAKALASARKVPYRLNFDVDPVAH